AVQETADEVAEPMSAASSATTASRARGAARRRATAVTGDMPSVDSVRAHPEAQRRTLLRLFAGCMRGRVMYAVPYATPDEAWPLGIELTDSPWVVLNLGLAARVGLPALRRIRQGHRWSASVHSVGYPLLDETGTRRPDVPWPCNAEKWIARFPETGDVWSFGTGFGAARLADCTA
ncbi:MAG TPA: hypothetical protein VFK68_06370, partial [Propionibacteriaceae bacterium]|nr:hypothetical protein [Propionibacteriaceae bacterium]